ncbi:glycerol-3-phosphate acyltransferase 1, mitochondrial isoform X1 [Petromyzon marinus]|uniref:glycerol-3-phosphate acyltransferase 1, mitochondrial isoform X1 n=1 Tax=Petromyzon marinus TaxID=7757 RepID=UPI003F6E6B7B
MMAAEAVVAAATVMANGGGLHHGATLLASSSPPPPAGASLMSSPPAGVSVSGSSLAGSSLMGSALSGSLLSGHAFPGSPLAGRPLSGSAFTPPTNYVPTSSGASLPGLSKCAAAPSGSSVPGLPLAHPATSSRQPISPTSAGIAPAAPPSSLRGPPRPPAPGFSVPRHGKQAAASNGWVSPPGPAPPHHHHPPPAASAAAAADANANPVTSQLSFFKKSPYQIETFLGSVRPFLGRSCGICTPRSREMYFTSSIPALGLRNVIFVNETHTRHRGWLARRLSYLLFVTERDAHKERAPKNVTDLVLNHTRVRQAISETSACSDPKAEAQQRKKAQGVLKRMTATVSPVILRLAGWVLLRLFNSFFRSVLVHRGQLEMVRQAAAERRVPLVFLPVHKSHVDYLLLTFILFCHDLQAPYIVSGDNLNLPIVGRLIRNLGGFFIKRRMDEEAGRKDILYRSLLHTYVEELVRQGQWLEVFVEGTRSRSGRAGTARAGLLSVLVDAVNEGAVPDALVVPVGIAYDRALEGNFNREQLGQPKKSESLLGILGGALRMLWKNYGYVRVDFAQPYSLKEYMQTMNSMDIAASRPHKLLPSILNNSSSGVRGSPFLTSPPRRPDPDVNAVHRANVANLASHALYTAVRCSAIMSTNIVACLLLYKHRQGVSQAHLVEDFSWLKELVLSRHYDIGFSGRSEDAVAHALGLLSDGVMRASEPGASASSAERDDADRDALPVRPLTHVPAVFEMSYYASGLLPVFGPEAVVACAVNAAAQLRLADVAMGHAPSEVSMDHGALLLKTTQLSSLLLLELNLLPPCHTLEQTCFETVQKFIDRGKFTCTEDDEDEVAGKQTKRCHRASGRMSPTLAPWSDQGSDSLGEEGAVCGRQLKLLVPSETLDWMIFLQRILGPVIEAYSSVAIFLHGLTEPLPESELMKKAHRHLLDRTERHVAGFDESATMSLARNAVTTFKEIGVLAEVQEESRTLLNVAEGVRAGAGMQRLAEFVLQFTP